jgi:hypothetical protein
MCTITYLPLPGGSALLTHSRDESLVRPAARFPVRQQRGTRYLLFPQDPEGGGSWIATDEKQRLVCLMNGGKGQHEPRPPYRMSRGQVLLDAAAASTAKEFISHYPLYEIEPFTILFFEQKKSLQITALVWDGQEKYSRNYAPEQPYIWSAPQIYPSNEQQLRERWFRQWLRETPSLDSEAAMQLHTQEKDDQSYSLLLQHELARTVSVTQATIKAGSIELVYTPLPENR